MTKTSSRPGQLFTFTEALLDVHAPMTEEIIIVLDTLRERGSNSVAN